MANITPLYIFDIDGTLCNIEHRLHFLENKGDPDRWEKFYKACIKDKPNEPVLKVLDALVSTGNEIWFFSGRSEDVRAETNAWLHNYTPFWKSELEDNPELLTMRPSKNYTEDHIMKEQWLRNMLDVDRKRLVAVFDDRKRVVDMWRANGVPCFQVAPGEF